MFKLDHTTLLCLNQKIILLDCFLNLNPPSRETELLEFVHSDLCGPMNTRTTLDGALYFVAFINDYSI